MAIKTILAALTTKAAASRILPVACDLARRHGAHLTALHTLQEIAIPSDVMMHVGAAALAGFREAQQDEGDAIRAIFDAHTKNEDFVSEWRQVDAASSSAADRLIDHARSADLLVMSQGDPDQDRSDQHHIQERAIRESGRPVLVIPYMGKFESVGRNVMIGWSPTREATRAAHDALTLVDSDAEIWIVTAHSSSRDAGLAGDTAAEMALCYDRHGFRATVLDRVDDGISPGDVLLNESFEKGSDLIVTGAFGHSRAYDLLFGATTSHLLKHMTAPVLFSS